jgi:methionyl-tRNA synthetase
MPRLAVLLGVALFCAACSEPPQKEIDRAQGAIDAARAAGAERYASDTFKAATSAIQEAHEAVDQRDYRLALSRAIDASERAQQAAREAADGKARVRAEAEQAIQRLATALQQLRAVMKGEGARAPATVLTTARHADSSAEAALQKARALLKREQYLDALEAVKGADARITEQIRVVPEAARARQARRRS